MSGLRADGDRRGRSHGHPAWISEAAPPTAQYFNDPGYWESHSATSCLNAAATTHQLQWGTGRSPPRDVKARHSPSVASGREYRRQVTENYRFSTGPTKASAHMSVNGSFVVSTTATAQFHDDVKTERGDLSGPTGTRKS